MFFGEDVESRGIYMVGIGGVSMSALAKLLRTKGIRVRGSDDAESCFTRELRAAGIPVSIGRGEPVTEDTVVYTSAVGDDHAQIRAAKQAGKRLFSRAEFLGMVARQFQRTLSVAGCHGKTSTTAMLSHIFLRAGRPFTCHIGGEDLDLGNFYGGEGDDFITEACEFRRSFLELQSEIAVILNCDLDHTDCYRADEELLEAYAQFARNAKAVVVNADDVRARAIAHAMDFGLYSGRIRAERLSCVGEKYAFTVTENDIPVVRIRLGVVGKVHVYNALAAYSVARLCGLSGEEIRAGLEDFHGVKRRFEPVGTLGGVPVVCDYAHHPKEIAAAIKTAERLTAGSVRLVFQPHTYTRTRDLLEQFVSALSPVEAPIVYRTYSAREPFDYAGSAVMLVSKIPTAIYVQSPDQLLARLKRRCREGDLILVLGAGDIYEIAKSILD